MEAFIARGFRYILFPFPEVPLLTRSTGDGGSYPECHVAQYPLNLGKKKVHTMLFMSPLYTLTHP
jgi:hypothetical protein